MGQSADDAAAFAAHYDAYAPALFRAACGLLGSAADAEDAVHDVFVALARSRARLAGIVDVKAYLFAALRHAAAKRRRRPPAGPLPDHLPAAEPPTADADLASALARLPPEQRAAVVLKIDGDLTFAELAAVLNVSPNTAASRYRYALEKLRTMLGGEP
jgi:RNA polymerase sigma-70 factor, ECF subfamily